MINNVSKKSIFGIIALAAVIVFAGCGTNPQPTGSDVKPSGGMTLDQAIAEAAGRIDERIEKGSKIALLNFTSLSDQFSSYVLDELTANLLETGSLTVVDRKEVDLIRSEFDFQFSGDVGDDSMQELGRMLGAQSIVSGSLTKIGDDYRIVIRVLNVQTASVAVQYRTDINNDSRVQALLEGGRSGGTATTAGGGSVTQTGTTGGTAQAATPAQNTAPANGTYIFYPRLRAMAAGRDINAYLDRIVIRSGYFLIYLVGAPTGDITRIAGPEGPNSWYIGEQWLTLQDLDTPRLSYNAVNVTYEEPRTISYQNIRQGRRFSLTANWHGSGIPHIFEEIDLDKAEYEP
jgi:TolB-like protein